MSEGTSTIKKAIPIIAVTWILSLVTILAVVYFAPNIFPKTWHEVARFEGYDVDGYWESFKVPSMHWRVEWISWHTYAFSEVPEDARFFVIVDGFALRELTGDDTFEYYGEDYFTGSGLHWIEVYAKNTEWLIIVEAYY
jgi:hypothetical protein